MNFSILRKFGSLKFLLVIFLFSCASSAAQESAIEKVNTAQLIELKKDPNLQLVDVRTPAEFEKGYIEGASLIDFTQADFSSRVASLDRDKPIAVYCAVGGRSGRSTAVLKELGFTKIYDLKGGMQGWISEGLPVSN